MEKIVKTEEQILKDIAAGKYRNCYLVYDRKSTDEPDNQKNSIKYQRAENTRFAQKVGLVVAPFTLTGFCLDGVISERHSGFKEDDELSITPDGLVQYRIDRPKFQRLVRFLSKGLFKGVVVLCWDRISRNRGDDTVVRKLIKRGVDIRFVYAQYENTSAGALHMDIDGMFAEHHSRVTGEKIRNTTRDLRDRGICTYKARIGYLNLGTVEHKPFDPDRASIVKRLFELAAEGWTISGLTKWSNDQGLTIPPRRRKRTAEERLAEEDEDLENKIEPISRPMTRSIIHRMLTSPFYTGKTLNSVGIYVPSKSHEALVSEELFAKVQRALAEKRRTASYGEKLDLPYRGAVRCSECRRVYTPYIQKGIQYFYARCREDCQNPRKSFNVAFLEGEIGKCLTKLSFTEEELVQIDANEKPNIAAAENERQKLLDQYDRQKRKLGENLAYLRENKLTLLKTATYSPEGYVDEEQKLTAKVTDLDERVAATGSSLREVLENAINLSELLKYGSSYYPFAKSAEKERFTRIVFSELLVSGKSLDCQCENGFKALQSRFVSFCGPNVWISELAQKDNLIKESIDALKVLLNHQGVGS